MRTLSTQVAIILIALFIIASCKKEEDKTDFITFEGLPMDVQGYWNGSDHSGGFTCGNAFFRNTFTDWGGGITSWEGFGYSRLTDRVTPGIGNQYSCYAGTAGPYDSKTFCIISIGDTIVFNIPEKLEYFYVANSTYAAISMRDGDMFAKKFGGEDGNDPDFFNLVITPIDETGHKLGTITLSLADYTSDNSEEDYISNTWTKIPFSDWQIGYVKKLAFAFESSDTGEYGINTPTYACIDNIKGEKE